MALDPDYIKSLTDYDLKKKIKGARRWFLTHSEVYAKSYGNTYDGRLYSQAMKNFQQLSDELWERGITQNEAMMVK